MAAIVLGLGLGWNGTAALADATQAEDEGVTRTTAMVEFGEPEYPEGFEHFAYVNPDAPKGGSVRIGAFGSFDSLNTIIVRGQWPAGIGLISDSLMAGSADELSSAYALIAEWAEYPEDKSWIRFRIREEAEFHDGEPITSEDFEYTFETIGEIGRPFLRSFYNAVDRIEIHDERDFTVHFNTEDDMSPLIIAATTSPLPKHFWEGGDRDITRTTLDPILGSGPYRIKSVDGGRSITYERVDDYWAADLPARRGQNNFDEVTYEYYQDETVMFEAFVAGQLDFRTENRAQRWNTGYDFDAVRRGDVITEAFPDETPRGLQGFFFNSRRDQFSDPRVREALGYLYDFETTQRQLLYGEYQRAKSYFPNSDFGARGEPTPEELEILEPFRDQLPEEVFTAAYEPPETRGDGNIRDNMREAMRLFREAGWELQDGRLVDAETGRQMRMEILLVSPGLVRLTEPYIRHLERVGIDANVRLVDTAQYQRRTDVFDFDVVSVAFNFFPPPGGELRSFYGSLAAQEEGSANYAGIDDPVVDTLIERIIQARDLETLKATTRALDRVLLWGHYAVPHWYNDENWVAYRSHLDRPDRMPRYSVGFPQIWWSEDAASN